jgi:hypothetical protein
VRRSRDSDVYQLEVTGKLTLRQAMRPMATLTIDGTEQGTVRLDRLLLDYTSCSQMLDLICDQLPLYMYVIVFCKRVWR